ncbi:hypothetical protein [Streptomyces sp. NBC_01012]|uniref:hypothetical protein n=1 Tax=Streptomyces sp. NBC_01012 TaxID=2903717 RepID=UPI003867D2F4|nr:hypothetical protein OG623_03805 [Streptomyces sp. NBC_01012]
MDSAGQWTGRRFIVRQENRLKAGRYTVRKLMPDGSEGEVLARTEVKHFSIEEKITFHSGVSGTRVLFTIEERGAGDGYDVRDAEGNLVGGFEEEVVASLVRSTWVLDQPGFPAAVGRERNRFVAVLRRVWDFLPLDLVPFLWPYHFDFETGGKQVLKVDRKWGPRDLYVVDILTPGLDPRLVVAQAVALDTFQDR